LNFSELGLSPALMRAVDSMGLHLPTPIQAQAIPAVLQGRDVWACAPTGSGKTLAYVLPLVQKILQAPKQTNFRRPIRCLVLVPTRELAVQVGQVMHPVSEAQGLKIVVAHGGVSINPQMMALRGGADVVVSTTGRLLDLVAHNALRLSEVQHLVLDEADRLLELGFADELQAVLALLPPQRQTLLFSATFADDLSVWAHQGLRDPLRMRSDAIDVQDAPDIAQSAIAVDDKKRTALLRHLIATQGWQRVLVFVATRYACAHLASKLCTAGVRASALHGDMSQGGRQAALQDFKDSRIDVLVTTDLASRGIDIALLPVVINYDLPRSADDYTHRIGRTARAGAQGQAVSFVSAQALAHWRLIQKRAQVQLTLDVVPGFEPTDEPAPAPGVGGIKGKRPSKKDKLRAASLQSES
jgi:superfamily II DNA/RNA helicase